MTQEEKIISNLFSKAHEPVVEKDNKLVMPNIGQQPLALQAILKDKLGRSPAVTASDVPKAPAMSVEGYSLPADPITLILYTLVKLSKSNTEIKQTLDAFSFTMKDLNGKPVYPEAK